MQALFIGESVTILVGETDRVLWPADPKTRLIPPNASLVGGMVDTAAEILDLDIVGEGKEPVGSPRRKKRHEAVLCAELETGMLSIGRLCPSDVKTDIPDRPAQNPDQLRLLVGRKLVVHAPQGSALLAE